jgi:hypothetical protein
VDETQTCYERDEADNIPWQKSNPCLSAVSAATYNTFRTIKKRTDSGEWVGVFMDGEAKKVYRK